jgi:hypothetical protein
VLDACVAYWAGLPYLAAGATELDTNPVIHFTCTIIFQCPDIPVCIRGNSLLIIKRKVNEIQEIRSREIRIIVELDDGDLGSEQGARINFHPA